MVSILVQSWEDKRFHSFPIGIRHKANVRARLKFELAYYDVAVLLVWFEDFSLKQIVVYYTRYVFDHGDDYVETTSDTDYVNHLALPANTPAQAEFLLHSLKKAAKDIGLCVNSNTKESRVSLKMEPYPY